MLFRLYVHHLGLYHVSSVPFLCYVHQNRLYVHHLGLYVAVEVFVVESEVLQAAL